MIDRNAIIVDSRKLIDKIDGLSFEQLMIILKGMVENYDEFVHIRYGDGENICMFQYFDKKYPRAWEFPIKLADRMLESAQKLFKLSYDRCINLLVGSPFITSTEPDEQNVFINYWASVYKDKLLEFDWCQGDFWYYHPSTVNVSTSNILELFDTIRKTSKNRKVVLVSNHTIANTRYCLGAESLLIPGNRKAWTYDGKIQVEIDKYAKEDALFIWCSGIPGKVWLGETAIKYPNTSHIDIGSFFDLAFGDKSRGWMRRKRDGEYTIRYEDEIIPYIMSFIPKV